MQEKKKGIGIIDLVLIFVITSVGIAFIIFIGAVLVHLIGNVLDILEGILG